MSTPLGKAMVLALALSSTPAVILADPFTSVVVYGDSLSDNGNLFAATGGTIPGPPYFDGRRSNGPVAVEQLATTLGVPLQDFAWIGATTGIGNFGDGGTPTGFGSFGLPGMQTELAGTAGLLGPFLSSGLFVVWGGANDFLAPSPLDSFPSGVIARGVSDLVGIVTTLQGLGAQHILVPGMPDLGLTPFFESLGRPVWRKDRQSQMLSTPLWPLACLPESCTTTRRHCCVRWSPTRRHSASRT